MRGPVNVEAIHLDNMMCVMESHIFGQREAASIVGGLGKLLQLITDGKVRAEKRTPSQNGKWYCNAADVLRHCRKA